MITIVNNNMIITENSYSLYILRIMKLSKNETKENHFFYELFYQTLKIKFSEIN